MPRKHRKFGPRLTVSLTENDYGALSALAEKDDVSVSWVVRRAIDEYLDNKADPALPLRAPQPAEKSVQQTGRK